MKRLLVLLLLSASVASAEETKLPRTTVMHVGKETVTLKAGTMVKVIEQGDKDVTIKVAGKVGTISWNALDDTEMTKAPPRMASPAHSAGPSPVANNTPAPVATPAPASATPPRPAQSMYGRMVEKAKANEAAHDKNLVKPTDEVLDGK